MANIKSQLKRIKTNEKSRQRNKATKSALKTSIRRFREAADAGEVAKGCIEGRHPQESGRQPQVRNRVQGGASGSLRQEALTRNVEKN